MNYIVNRMILFMICFASAAFMKLDTAFILCAFLSLFFTCINYYADHRLVRIISSACYLILVFLFPSFLLFLPLITYDIFLARHLLLWLAAALIVGMTFTNQPVYYLIFSVLGMILSVILCQQTILYKRSEERYRKNRDDSIELTLLLEDKNRAILEEQNREIYTATLKERNRIAREIHDNVGHLLSRSILMTGAIKATNQNETLTPQLNMLDETLNNAMDTIRTSVHNLHDQSINLQETLNNLVQSFDFCPIQMEYGIENVPDSKIIYCLISITKESLSNIIKHSNATQVQIVIREHPAMYQLIIKDNGTNAQISSTPGIGITNMKDRVATLKGNIAIDTHNGFRIFISIPKN